MFCEDCSWVDSDDRAVLSGVDDVICSNRSCGWGFRRPSMIYAIRSKHHFIEPVSILMDSRKDQYSPGL